MLDSPKHIWLLSGYAGSGKDATADILVHLLGPHRVARASFAGAVKDDVARLYGIDRYSMDTQEGKARLLRLANGETLSVRDILIRHAETTKHQTEDPAIWAKRIQPPTHQAVEHWIFSDWRFPAEKTALRERFPAAILHTLRIQRPSVSPSTSYTEHLLDQEQFNYTIENSGSLLYLSNQLANLLESVATTWSIDHTLALPLAGPPCI